MKYLKFLFLFVGIATFISCNKSDVEEGLVSENNQAIFTGTIGALHTRATDANWQNGDAIGVYALNAGASLSETAIFDGKANVKYTTNTMGEFAATGASINFPSDGDLDFVAYYPYQTAIADYKYSIDVSTQSDFAAIDILYSNNAKTYNKNAPNVDLVFNHMLSKLVLNIEVGENLTSLQGLTAQVNNIVVDGSLALANGSVTTGSTISNITPIVSIATDKKTAFVTALVVPGQNLKDAEVVLNLGGKKYKWSPEAQMLESTFRYTYTLKLKVDESGQPVVEPVIIGADISDWGDPEIGDTPIILDPKDEEDEGQAYYPSKEAYRLEMPRLSEDVVNDKAKFVYHYTKDNVGDTRLNYSMEYNYATHHTRWVAFTFYDRTSEVNTSRSDSWSTDPFLTDYTDNRGDYKGSGYSRGHLVASSDRLYSKPANQQTFFYSNMSPQVQSFNGGIWLDLERKVQDWGGLSAIRDTLYIVKGGTIRDDQVIGTIGYNKIAVPKHYFMALLAKKGNSYKSIAFWFEHKKSYSRPYDLTKSAVTVKELEELTGIDFFHNLPNEIENVVEKQKNFNDWPDI